MPHMSHSTISLGESELSFLHLMQIISVVVSSTALRKGGRERGGIATNYIHSMVPTHASTNFY